jgi:hypothetical protein
MPYSHWVSFLVLQTQMSGIGLLQSQVARSIMSIYLPMNRKLQDQEIGVADDAFSTQVEILGHSLKNAHQCRLGSTEGRCPSHPCPLHIKTKDWYEIIQPRKPCATQLGKGVYTQPKKSYDSSNSNLWSGTTRARITLPCDGQESSWEVSRT